MENIDKNVNNLSGLFVLVDGIVYTLYLVILDVE
jgi:hypothetical protein